MNPLSQLNSRMTPSYMPSNIAAGKPPVQVVNDGDAMAKRSQDLGKATTDLAQNLMQSFSKQLFGDAAKGMTIRFDQAELSSSSSFAAATEQSAEGSAAAFRLEDSSHFSGKGKLYTADGRQFDFAIDVRYKSVLEAASVSSFSPQSAFENHFAGLNQQFAGTADDLLQHLSSEPKPQIFELLGLGKEGQPLSKLMGEMTLQLLNLPGGPRHLDLSPNAAAARFADQA